MAENGKAHEKQYLVFPVVIRNFFYGVEARIRGFSALDLVESGPRHAYQQPECFQVLQRRFGKPLLRCLEFAHGT